MSSLAMSSFVEQQIVLHQFTAKHSAQARVMLGWSREDLARQAGLAVEVVQRFESLGEVEDQARLALAFRLEAQTDADNIAEQRALERIGFRREGVLRQVRFRHGVWQDMLIYGLLRAEIPDPLQ